MNISRQTLQADLLAVWVIATTSLCLGLLFNQFRDKPLPLVYQSKEQRVMAVVEKIASKEPTTTTGQTSKFIDLAEFRAVLETNEAIILDARPEIFHRLGHIPGALSLPREAFEAGFTQHRTHLEADKSRLLVIYCSGSACEDSELVRKALHGLGFTRVSIFKGGWSAWTAANLPEERTP